MDEKTEAQLIAEQALEIAENNAARIDGIEKMLKEIQAKEGEQLFGQGGYASSTPTADGTIPMTYKGQRYNVLVDKQ